MRLGLVIEVPSAPKYKPILRPYTPPAIPTLDSTIGCTYQNFLKTQIVDNLRLDILGRY